MREGFERFSETSAPADPNRIFAFHLGGTVSDILLDITTDGFIHYRVDGTLHPTIDADNQHSYIYNAEPGLDEFKDLYFTNRQATGVVVHANHPPLYIVQNYLGEITTRELAQSEVPMVNYLDDKSPSSLVNSGTRVWTITFGPTQSEWVNGSQYALLYGDIGEIGPNGELVNDAISTFYFTDGATLIEEMTHALRQNPHLSNPSTTDIDIVETISGLEYTISLTGVGNSLNLRSYVVSAGDGATIGADNTTGANTLQSSSEPAWSYPFTVLHGGTYYRCIQPHFSDTATTEPGVGTDWALYWEDTGTTAPSYNTWQPSSLWNADTYYSPWDRGFPTVAVFYQQRLLLMSAKDAGTGVWGSRIGNYRDFHLGPDSNDPFYFDIDTSDSPDIKWAEAQRQLILGTSSGDYSVTAEIALSPSDIQASRQNAARSKHTAAVTINTDIFYIEQGNEKVRTTGYSDSVEAQTSRDISLMAEHLLRPRMKRIVLMQTPEVVIFGLRQDGSLSCISYAPEQNVGAWYEFVSQGDIIDIAVAYSVLTDEDELWATVKYDGVHYIEKMPYPNRDLTSRINQADATLTQQGIVCMDGWTTGTISQGDNNIIQGLDQYEGLTIGCIVDDAWAGEYTVKEGVIILNAPDIDENWAGTYAVGFIYDAIAKTFEFVGGNQRGSGHGTVRRWNKLHVRLLDSVLPVINGTLPADRTPETLMGIPELVRQGLQDVIIRNVGYGDGSITFEQNRPYPTHILGCYGEFSIGNS